MKKLYLILALVLSVNGLVFASADTEEITSPRQFKMGSVGSTLSEVYIGTGTVDSGLTSEAVTVTGISTSARCNVTLSEIATNSISVRAAVPTANTLTVEVSGDPGVSNADFNYTCIE